ncbi:hypothetical protein SAMN02799622_05796 [Methylobacterium sp. UNC378MF]|nr:hypothetical protein SAMN02799622_05796 [Methylobacterium sp. UNC378MF]
MCSTALAVSCDTGAVTAFTGCEHPSKFSRRPGGYYGRPAMASRTARNRSSRVGGMIQRGGWFAAARPAWRFARRVRSVGPAVPVSGSGSVPPVPDPFPERMGRGGTGRESRPAIRHEAAGESGSRRTWRNPTRDQRPGSPIPTCNDRHAPRRTGRKACTGRDQAGWPADSNRKPSRLGIVTAAPLVGFDRRQGRSERARMASDGRSRRMRPSSPTSSIARNP